MKHFDKDGKVLKEWKGAVAAVPMKRDGVPIIQVQAAGHVVLEEVHLTDGEQIGKEFVAPKKKE